MLMSFHNVDRDCTNYVYVTWSELLDVDYECVHVTSP